ncbi:isoprenyl transferase [Enterovirga sp.]|jgi:undecaprenyl diphosphate synthase|uniref:isoprenyl transferase n=1 Tax=Enterovirga sp. TaxID=2026350 RepID=UPI0026060481|nr:isoprenyl transferase [Enterovirga sp.]MDB5591138.1 di-trans,poly-cis-decaprenylcistransferase [Enterovirga sp.]
MSPPSTALDTSLADLGASVDPCAGTPPAHVAIIMDGNGRWAARRGLPRIEGHRRGVDAVRRAVRCAAALGIRYLTVYGFSTENWRRPPAEVADLFGLLKRFIRNDLAELHDSNVRVLVIGDRTGLSADVLALLDEAQDLTRRNTGLTLTVAFNYGGRQEIARAMRALARLVRAGQLDPDAIDVAAITAALDTSEIPDPDLVIRTSGEMRVSNFLPWQTAYSEFVFLPDLWPDFDDRAFRSAVSQFMSRDRRFGGRGAEAV